MRHALRILTVVTLFALAAMPLFASYVVDVGHYEGTFVGVTYNPDGTSTWKYSLTWDKVPPGLSHFGVEFCGTAKVISYSPTVGGIIQQVSVGPDPSLDCPEGAGMWGIKWDLTSATPTYPLYFQFTLDKWYMVGEVRFAAKAGQDCNVGQGIFGPTCEVAKPEITVTKSCTPDVFVGDMIAYKLVVKNTGNVPLDDVVISDPPVVILPIPPAKIRLEPGETFEYSWEEKATAAGTVVNEVTVSGHYFGNYVNDTDSCTTKVWDINVSKTASASYKRTYDWTITKEADPEEAYLRDPSTGYPVLEFCEEVTLPLEYEVTVDRTYQDSDWYVTGTITITNPAPIPAYLALVADVISPDIPVTPDCGGTLIVPAGGSLVCTYASALPDSTDRTNTATVTLINGHAVPGSALIVFPSPEEINHTIHVTDTITCAPGFTCNPLAFGPFEFSQPGSQLYSIIVTRGADGFCGSWFDTMNTALIVEEGDVAKAPIHILTCDCGLGCTLTIGYWKNHAGFTGRNDDDITPLLTKYGPVWLGTANTGKSLKVDTALKAVDVLSMNVYGDPSNGITKLYAQMLGAKLNILNGASGKAVKGTITAADAFLATYDWKDWTLLTAKQQKDVLKWALAFDQYNNGLIGPGHCD